MVIKSANRQIRIPKYREFPGSQWSGLHTFTAEVSDSIPSKGNDPTSLAAQPKEKKKYSNTKCYRPAKLSKQLRKVSSLEESYLRTKKSKGNVNRTNIRL